MHQTFSKLLCVVRISVHHVLAIEGGVKEFLVVHFAGNGGSLWRVRGLRRRPGAVGLERGSVTSGAVTLRRAVFVWTQDVGGLVLRQLGLLRRQCVGPDSLIEKIAATLY